MKRLVMIATMTVGSFAVAAEADSAAILKQLQALQQQVQQQQKQIDQLQTQLQRQQAEGRDELKGLVQSEVKHEVDAAIESNGFAQLKEAGSLLTLPGHISNLKLKGDLRLRYERREGDDDVSGEETQKSRFRTRFRLGFVWNSEDERWEVAAGLATGGESGTSTNNSWNEDDPFETGDIRLDYAYARHNWQDLSFTVGQQKNPFETTFILWDSDLRPTGASLAYSNGLPVFATVGAYNVSSDSDIDGDGEQETANMYAGQVGLEFGNDRFEGMLAAAYYHYDSNVSEDCFNLGEDYEYRIGDLYGTLSTKIGDLSLQGYGQLAVNFGADDSATQLTTVPAGYEADDENMAWVLGLNAAIGPFNAGYAYAHIEGDSVPFFFVDSDFGDGLPDDAMNAKGHVVTLGYKITKHLKLGLEGDFTQLIENDGTNDPDVALYQLDLQYKF